MAALKDRRLRPPRFAPIAIAACLAVALGAGGTAAAAAPPTVQRGAPAQPAAHHDVSPPLRDLASSGTPGHAYPARPLPGRASAQADAARQSALGGSQAPTLGLGFDGMGNGFSGPNGAFSLDSAPPDTAGAVGPSHYVQIVNEGVTVFNKLGTAVYGPVSTNTFWSGFGGGCQTNNNGDGTVEYDRQANRWVISQFSVDTTPYLECVAVSQTGDPTGAYNRYSFSYAQFPDYPKLAVWPDAYYVTFNMFNGNTLAGGKACAYDRAKMLAGQAATQQCFDTGSTYGSLLGSDLDGPTAPPAGSPNYLVALGADTSSLAYWKFHVDWTTPANTTFAGPTALSVSPYAYACGGDFACIPQSGTTQVLDSLGDRLMYRLAYRRFDDHEALVANHSITSGSSVGVRWYELRVSSGNLGVFQQGTFTPDTTYRWMGSAAMDKNGDIALGYSASSSSLHPGIRYTARVPGDAAGTMGQGEGTIITGAGSQTKNLGRWGDYSSLTVDPSDDCTFWYDNEYIPANGTFNWRTRIATFNVAGCPGAAPSPPAAPTGVTASSSNGSVSLSWSASSGATAYKVFRGTSPGGEASTPVGTPTGTSFTDTGRTNGTTYYYKVEATNAGGDSAPSSEVSATPVATPTGLSATPSGTSVSLDWSDAAGATSYRVFRGTSPGGESSTPLGTPSGSAFNDTGLTAGNRYYYKVSAVNSTGSSPQSGEANALLAPPAPLNVHATPGDGQVSLTWSAANGAASYKVLRAELAGQEGTTAIATPSGTSFTDTNRTNGTQYFYVVKATNPTGDSPASAEVNATPSATPPPPAPTGLTATAGNGSVSLSWSASSGATSYRVYRGTSPGGESSTAIGSPSGTSFSDSGLTNGRTYYYRVSAVGAGGEGSQSSEANATPQAPAQQQQPPSQPTTTTTTTTTTSVPPIPLPPQLIQAAADTTPPSLTIAGVGKQKLSDALKKGVAVDLGCSEPCTDAVTLLLDFKTAHALHLVASKTVKVGSKSFTLSAAGHRKVRVPFSSKAKKRLKRARKVTVTVRVAGRDKSGNKVTKTKRLALR